MRESKTIDLRKSWRELPFGSASAFLSPAAHQVLAALAARLQGAEIPEASIEARVLVMHATGWSRTQLLSTLREGLPDAALAVLEGAVTRRLSREPLAYITGHREFFGLDILVDKRVLVPRQETECLVEQVIAIATKHYAGSVTIADVGTGSGAIAVALATALPASRVYATDASAAALDVARENVRRHALERLVSLLHGDLIAPLPSRVDIMVANLPYIPVGEWEGLQPEIRLYEPRDAVLGGVQGLDCVMRLLEQVQVMKERPAWIALELGEGQAGAVSHIARDLFPSLSTAVFRDLGGLERGVLLHLGA